MYAVSSSLFCRRAVLYDNASDESAIEYRRRPLGGESRGGRLARAGADREPPGVFRVRPLAESRAFPEVGFYRQEAELSDSGSDEALLRRIAEFTGGRFNARPAEVFDAAGRTVASTMRLWPALLVIAGLLNLVELVLRKWKGILEALTRRVPEAAPAAN